MIENYFHQHKNNKIAVEEIFFLNSNQKFQNIDEKIRFREKWFDIYKNDHTSIFLVYLDDGKVAGYVNGLLTTTNKFEKFVDLENIYPAHLHINVHPSYQGKGVGKILLQSFFEQLKIRNVYKVHIVTGIRSRNVAFYEKNGFAQLLSDNERGIVFMGKDLS